MTSFIITDLFNYLSFTYVYFMCILYIHCMYNERSLTITGHLTDTSCQAELEGRIKLLPEVRTTRSITWGAPICAPRQMTYDDELQYYSSIAEASLHLICNKGNALDDRATREVLFAILRRKPVVLLHPPAFSADSPMFARELIMDRLSKFLICDLEMLDDTDLQSFLENSAAEPINYVLTKHETTLIRSLLRAHFRNLLPIQA